MQLNDQDIAYELRPPQQDILSQIRKYALSGHRRILVSAATGIGKTILSYDICRTAKEKGSRVLFTAHRIQLAEQTFKKFSSLSPSFLQGDSDGYDHDNLVQVATLQTLINREIETPNIVIIDEVHYAYNSTLIQSLFDRFPDALFIGLSATPVGADDYLLEGFDSIIDTYQTADLIRLQWLVPFVCFSPIKIDLSQVKIKGEDYDEEDLEKTVNVPSVNKSIVENYKKHGEGRKFICFAVNKKHATELVEAFNTGGIPVGMIVAGTTQAQREHIFKKHEAGTIKGIINIEILTAGYDSPSISCVILACPTKAWKKYIQCCGRGIRLYGNSYLESMGNGKSDCILLDCASAISEHGLPDQRRVFKFRPKISRVVDRQLKIDENDDEREEKIKRISVEKSIFLKKIGSLLDLYESKEYAKENELQDDVNKFLERTGYFWWRQNSGKAFIEGRWVHFASKAGLPDNAVFYKNTSFYFGLEVKLAKGKLTDKQKETLPEMTEMKVLYFIIENVFDVYTAIEHIETHTEITDQAFTISKEIYQLPQRQVELRSRLKLELYT